MKWPCCRAELPEIEILRAARTYDSNLDFVSFECPQCAQRTEAMLSANSVGWGYVGAATKPFFSVMDTVPLAGLSVSRGPASYLIELGAERAIVPLR